MKVLNSRVVLLLCLWGGLLKGVVYGQQPTAKVIKIPIDPQRWYQPTNAPDSLKALFDGVTSVNVSPGYGKVITVVDAFYPLQPGEKLNIQSIRFFDGWGSIPNSSMTLSIITSTWQRIPIASFTGVQYGWVGPYPNRPTTFTLDNAVTNARYLVLTSGGTYPTEMELYGSYTPPTAPVTKPAPAALASQKQVRLGQLFGVNAFEWDLENPADPNKVDTVRLRTVKNFTGVRHYLDWERLEAKQGTYSFNPTANGGWNYDALYKRLQQEGIEVLTCLKTVPSWLLASYPADQRDPENVPVRYGRSFTDPASYIEQARMAFQFTARYGRNKAVNTALLSGVVTGPLYPTAPTVSVRTREVGLGYVRYLECDNERDKWWKGRKAYQTPAEYAANLSAFYDGHKNTLGAGVGVKNADPTMQVVMGGLATPAAAYVQAMVDWCRQYRGYKADGSVNLCWDVINYHHYSGKAGSSQAGTSARGAAPEVLSTGPTAQALIEVAHSVAADMPVWVTEAGYDLNQGSPFKAIAIGSRSAEQTQADWLLRTSLAYARWGVERVFFYELYDDNPASPIQFGSMGLANTDHTPRLAARYLRQTNQLLGAYRYQQTLSTNPIVDHYMLNGVSAFMMVVPDEKGRTASYTLNMGLATYADVYRPTAGNAMAVQRVAVTKGLLTLQVTETPLFIVPERTPLPVTLLNFTAQLQPDAAAVRLDWATASELNSASYQVEHSLNGVDFSPIGQVAAAGNSTTTRTYHWLDTALPSETALIYYRLRQLDLDNTARYSPVRTVQLALSSLSLYPNPALHVTTLTGAGAGALVQLFDLQGRLILTAHADDYGTTQLPLPTGLATGVYLVRAGSQATRLTVE